MAMTVDGSRFSLQDGTFFFKFNRCFTLFSEVFLMMDFGYRAVFVQEDSLYVSTVAFLIGMQITFKE